MRDITAAKLPVPAIGKAFAILDYLVQSAEPRSLKEIYTYLKIPKTSAFSMLNSLIACGVVRKLETGAYIPGLRLYTLGIGARTAQERTRVFLPRLQALRDEVGYTVFMSIYENGEQVVWEKVDGFESVVFKAYLGERKRMNTSSAGKAIAAYLSENELNNALSRGMEQLTENTISSKDAFIAHLNEIKKRGYAVDDEESERGIFCLGVPMFAHDGRVFGAVSMSTIKSKMHFHDIDKYVSALKSAAQEMSQFIY